MLKISAAYVGGTCKVRAFALKNVIYFKKLLSREWIFLEISHPKLSILLPLQALCEENPVMFKTRNTGTGKQMLVTQGIEQSYLGECPYSFQGKSSHILGKVAYGMSPRILEDVLKHTEGCRQTFQEMSPNIHKHLYIYIFI